MKETLNVRIKRVRPGGANPLPCYMTAHSAGMDLYADLAEDITLAPGAKLRQDDDPPAVFVEDLPALRISGGLEDTVTGR